MASDDEEENSLLRVVRLPCLIGGQLKNPIVLPVIEEAGVQCVGINAWAAWLCQFLEGKTKAQCRSNVVRLVDELIDALKTNSDAEETSAKADDMNPSERSETSARAGETSARAGEMKGRAALGLEDDSDEEQFLQQQPCKKARRVKIPSDFQTISFNGMEITAKPRHRGRGVVIPVDGESFPIF